MKHLAIDVETFSSVNLVNTSVYKYAEAPDFEILLFGYAIDDEPVTVIDVTAEPIPYTVLEMLTDPNVIKQAFNANFERICLSRYMRDRVPGMHDYGFLPPEQWQCTMVRCMMLGLPRSLAEAGQALGLSDDKAKMEEGKTLIPYFCKPCKPTKTNGGRVRNYPFHAMDKWLAFKAYNARDVEAERTIYNLIKSQPVPAAEWEAYWLDQRINDRGVLIDMKLVEGAIRISEEHTDELTTEAVNLTGLQNVNSVSQLKGWLGTEGPLDKKTVQSLRENGGLNLKQDRVLAIRQEMGKTSVGKYEAMQRGVCEDGRVRGLYQFYGASRTGRWAGRQVQVQNLPQNHLEDLDLARRIVLDGDRKALQCLYGNVPDTLSQLIRTAFIAPNNGIFAVADFSAIEARVLAWLANETWRMEVFKEGKDIYCASASQMFHVPVEKHGVNGHLRQKGKIAELALGYGGSVGALKNMGALEMGLSEQELPTLVSMWRETNPYVTSLWWSVDRMVRLALERPGTVQNVKCADDWVKLAAKKTRRLLMIELPSHRSICYWEPRLVANENGKDNITYGGTDGGKWSRLETYGPKLVENIVQAISRDCLRDAMQRVKERYPGIVMHVHDEMIVEVPEEQGEEALAYMQECMAKPLPWAPGLLLRGDGYTTKYYRKD